MKTSTTIVRYRFRRDGKCTVSRFDGSEKVGQHLWKLGGKYTQIADYEMGKKVIHSGSDYFVYMLEEHESFENAKALVMRYIEHRIEETKTILEKLNDRLQRVDDCVGTRRE